MHLYICLCFLCVLFVSCGFVESCFLFRPFWFFTRAACIMVGCLMVVALAVFSCEIRMFSFHLGLFAIGSLCVVLLLRFVSPHGVLRIVSLFFLALLYSQMAFHVLLYFHLVGEGRRMEQDVFVATYT